MKKARTAAYILFPPLIVMAVILTVFRAEGMFPFGSGTVSWCDMDQQTIPLLMDLKDILDGKDSIFLNLDNAAGMNFYGVFFFFLASPFSFLVKFVDKPDMILFVNILVLAKLMTAALTCSVYFVLCKKKLYAPFGIVLSVMYACCGYGLLFYQNVIWLDMMYLFPLLAVSLGILVKKQNNIPYILTITAMLVVNYYISYMTVLYIILFMAVYVCRRARREKTSLVCVKFISGSVIGAMLSAVVWLPCFIQYLSSGRKKSVSETLLSSDFLTHYETVLPLLFCTSFMFVAYAASLAAKRNGVRESDVCRDNRLIFALMLLPFFIEPINIMWHTGNYMSFPARYGFITVFAGLVCCADRLTADTALPIGSPEPKSTARLKMIKYPPGIAAGIVLLTAYGIILGNYFESNWETLSNYTDTLWGDTQSFEGLAVFFIISLIFFGALYLIYRSGFAPKQAFAVMLCFAVVLESSFCVRLYMTCEDRRDPGRTDDFRAVTALAERIEDDRFYRVITDSKIMDYNMVGALGYPSLSHYTSLTDGDFMFAQKRLGYTSVWMEVGSCGGTELTNALYSAGYRIVRESGAPDAVYSTEEYSIVPTKYYISPGLVTRNSLDGCEVIPQGLTRAQIQQFIYSKLFGEEELISIYPLTEEMSSGVNFSGGKYTLSSDSCAVYRFRVNGRQSVYADCFDQLSNRLSEDYFDSLSISVNGINVSGKYPRTTQNGVLKLGEFEDREVEVRISCSKDISCYSFGVFGLDLDLMERTVNDSQSVGLTSDGGKLTGEYTSEKGGSCVVFLPYSDNFTVRINGSKTPYRRVFSDFVSFDLPTGENRIEISFLPRGFICGAAVSLLGLAALTAYIIFGRKISPGGRVLKISKVIVIIGSAAAMAAVYILPVMIWLSRYLY